MGRTAFRKVIVGFGAIAVAVSLVVWLTTPVRPDAASYSDRATRVWNASRNALSRSEQAEGSTGDRGKLVVLDQDLFPTVISFTGPIDDPRSLTDMGEAIRVRGRRAIAALESRSDRLAQANPPIQGREMYLIQTWRALALALMYEGKFDDAALLAETGTGTQQRARGAATSPTWYLGAARHHRPSTWGDRKLPRVYGAVDLHLSDRPCSRAP